MATKDRARMAGLLYLLMGVASTVSFGNIPTLGPGDRDAAAIVQEIAASQVAYRIGILCELVAQILSVFAIMALYRLLSGVNKKQAVLMVALGLVSVPMGFANMLLGIAPLVLLSGADYLSAFDKSQLDALAASFLNLRAYGNGANMAWFGIVLLPFGLLVIRSGFIPRIFGVLLIVGCFPYLIISVASLLFPAYADGLSRLLILAVGEILVILWLLIKGVRTEFGTEALRPTT
jgi:hypothetical protein